MESLGKPEPGKEKMDAAEMQSFLAIQNALALVAYINEHNLAISPMSFLKRDDEVAHKIRHDAGLEWAAEYAAQFRGYWDSNREEMLAFDAGDEAACRTLIEKL